MVVPVSNKPISVDEYHAMADRGDLDDLARVELLNGRIIEMPRIGPEHAYCTDTLSRLFTLQFAGRARARVQNPIALGWFSEPLPDFTLVRLPGDRYRHTLPGPDDVYLLIEVADSSVSFDLGEKAKTYAAAGIAEYWVVLIRDNTVQVHRNPSREGYKSIEKVGVDASIAPLAFPDSPIQVSALLG